MRERKSRVFFGLIISLLILCAGTAQADAPSIANITPATGSAGQQVTITGAGFGAAQRTSTVAFNGILATPSSWSQTSIVVAVPSGATTGKIVVTVGGVQSNAADFTVTNM